MPLPRVNNKQIAYPDNLRVNYLQKNNIPILEPFIHKELPEVLIYAKEPERIKKLRQLRLENSMAISNSDATAWRNTLRPMDKRTAKILQSSGGTLMMIPSPVTKGMGAYLSSYGATYDFYDMVNEPNTLNIIRFISNLNLYEKLFPQLQKEIQSTEVFDNAIYGSTGKNIEEHYRPFYSNPLGSIRPEEIYLKGPSIFRRRQLRTGGRLPNTFDI